MQHLQLLLLAVARGVHIEIAGVKHPGPAPGQPVADRSHRGLVAGDRVRAEYDGVPGTDLHPFAGALGHLGQSGPGFALGAGAHDQHPRRVDSLDVGYVAQSMIGDPQQPELAGQADVALHRQPQRGHGAPRADGGVHHLLDAVDVAGEGPHDHPAALLAADRLAQHVAHVPLRPRRPGVVGVGRVGQQQPHARVVGERADAGQRGAPAVHGREVELEVAGVQDQALRRGEGRYEAPGDRMGDRHGLASEGPRAETVAVANLAELGPVEQAGLGELVPHQTQRERRPVHRERQAFEEVRQGADVVLMGVGGDTGLHTPSLEQPFEIGQHRVHAGKVVPREHPAAVEQHPATGGLDHRAVAPDLPEAAQEGDGYRRGHSGLSEAERTGEREQPSGAGPWPERPVSAANKSGRHPVATRSALTCPRPLPALSLRPARRGLPWPGPRVRTARAPWEGGTAPREVPAPASCTWWAPGWGRRRRSRSRRSRAGCG